MLVLEQLVQDHQEDFLAEWELVSLKFTKRKYIPHIDKNIHGWHIVTMEVNMDNGQKVIQEITAAFDLITNEIDLSVRPDIKQFKGSTLSMLNTPGNDPVLLSGGGILMPIYEWKDGVVPDGVVEDMFSVLVDTLIEGNEIPDFESIKKGDFDKEMVFDTKIANMTLLISPKSVGQGGLPSEPPRIELTRTNPLVQSRTVIQAPGDHTWN